MPRFGTKALLIGFALVALWFSTFGGYRGSEDVRKSVLLLVLVAAAFAAIYGRGRRRAFWAGFTTVMVLWGGLNVTQPFQRYVPDFNFTLLQTPVFQSYAAPTYYAPPPPPASPPQPQPYAYPAPAVSGTFSTVTLAPAPYMPTARAIATTETIAALWTIAVASLCGLLVAFIYSQTRPTASEA